MSEEYTEFLNALMRDRYFRQEAFNYAVACGGDISWLSQRLRLLINKVAKDYVSFNYKQTLIIPPNYKSMSIDPLILELADLVPEEHPLRYAVQSYV